MNYEQALRYLLSFVNFERIPFEYRREFNLARMERLLEWFEYPQHSFPSVLIAGTKGKGSTAQFLSSILSAHGYKTGLYTSPHLVDPRERIQISGTAISKLDFAWAVTQIHKVLTKKKKEIARIGPITFFEIFTLAAMIHFTRRKVDIGIFEVGMGGRLDATNVLRPLVSVITSISYDHEEHLGHTLAAIASEKAAIIKPNSYVVSARQNREVERVIQREVSRKRAKAFFYGKDFFSSREKMSRAGNRFDFRIGRKVWSGFQITMAGQYQIQNASLSLQTAAILSQYGFQLKESVIRKGLKRAFWPGRFEQVNRRGRLWVIDGAHNGASMEETVKAIRHIYKKRSVTVILGVSREKQVSDILKPLMAIQPHLIFTKSHNPRAMEPKLILEQAQTMGFTGPTMVYPSLEEAIKIASAVSEKDSVLLITGSLFLVGEAREILRCPKFV